MASAKTWIKAGVAGIALCIGGPALVWYVTPTHDELFKRFNPELQKRSLETRQQRIDDHEQFLSKLKEYSRSDKPIWEAARLDQIKMREEALAAERAKIQADKDRMAEIKKQAMSGK